MRNPFPPPPVRPLALSDAEYAAVMQAAQPLQPHAAAIFLKLWQTSLELAASSATEKSITRLRRCRNVSGTRPSTLAAACALVGDP
jgi:hypothetical protein